MTRRKQMARYLETKAGWKGGPGQSAGAMQNENDN